MSYVVSLTMLNPIKVKLVLGIVRRICTTSQVSANHYDVLGITPRATQNDIKSAYYKLSKIHHPDISTDEKSTNKFRAIKEAYEVLGNIKLKKMYDKGLLTQTNTSMATGWQAEPEPTDPTLKFYKSHSQRHVTPTMDGRVPIYDFDSWSKNHYGHTFQKSQLEKEQIRVMKVRKTIKYESERQEYLMYMLLGLGGLLAFFVVNGTSDYDHDTVSLNKNNGNAEENSVKEK